jgi:class 3 adenylate cyclase
VDLGEAQQGDADLPEIMAVDSPAGGDHDYIHAAILFADIENSVMWSGTLPPRDYDNLLNSFQATMYDLAADLRAQGFPLAEFAVVGDQLSLFFYDAEEINRNAAFAAPGAEDPTVRAQLVETCRAANEAVLFAAFRAAIFLKDRWLQHEYNLERVRRQREPLGLGIGLHYGRVYLKDRADGRRRIEGFAVNLAKRVEGYARFGRYSRIMLSQNAHDRLRGVVIRHTQLRQRIYFHQHEMELELLKGVTEAQAVFELRFFSRIGVMKITPDTVRQYEAMFYRNPRNIWAYYQLFEYYAYTAQDWNQVQTAVRQALLTYPHDEKVLLDLARYYQQQGNLALAREHAQQALKQNPDFDLAYELLWTIAEAEGDTEACVNYLRKAVSLAPGSPAIHLNFGLLLCDRGQSETAEHHLAQALDWYPDYPTHAPTVNSVRACYEAGTLPESIAQRFGLLETAAAAD